MGRTSILQRAKRAESVKRFNRGMVETLENRQLLAVTALNITSVTSAADSDGNASDAHVSVPAGSTVTAHFAYSSDAANTTKAKFDVNTSPTTVSTLETVVGSGQGKSASLSVVIPAGTVPGSYNAHVQMKNGTGSGSTENDSEANSVVVLTIDVTAPEITYDITGTLGSNGWYTSDVTVDWTATDGESTPSPTSRTDSITSDGTHLLSFSSTSVGGTATENVTIKRDTAAPTTGLSPSSGLYLLNTNFSWNSADATSGVDSTLVELDGGTHSTANSGSGALGLGSHTVSVTTTDNAGHTTIDSHTYDITQALLDGNGDLQIVGLETADCIVVDATNPSAVTVSGITLATGQVTFNVTGRIIVSGNGGDDCVTVIGNVNAEIRGGAGNDTLVGGAGHDVIDGGSGSDHVTGGAGNDVLIAGGGSDRLVGSSGHDVLVAVTLSNAGSTYAALDSLRTSWLAKVGTNVSPTAAEVTDDTVTDGSDMLTGGAGADWFMVGSDDKITDLAKAKKTLTAGWYGDDFVDVLT